MRILVSAIGCAIIAVLWRAVDDRRDRRKARADLARMQHVVTALHVVALEENAVFDVEAARCEREGAAQRAHVKTVDITPRLSRDVKRAA